MAIEFKVPDLGENVDSGDIVNIMVAEGQDVQADQPVMEIETGKAVVELPCPIAGKVTKVHVQKGAKVKVGQPLLTLDSADAAPASKQPEAPQSKSSQPPESKSDASEDGHSKAAEAAVAAKPAVPSLPKSKPAAAQAKSTAAATAKPAPGQTPPAGPATRRLARELGVDLTNVAGTGVKGRITEDDIKAAVRGKTDRSTPGEAVASQVSLPEGVDERDAWGLVRRQAMPKIRHTIAVNMERSASTVPRVTNFDDADITELERIRKGGLADYSGTSTKLTMMPFVVKAVAQALRLHPILNASVDMDSQQILYKQYVNIGVAVDTDRGLVVPVLRDADRMSIPRIAQSLTSISEQARNASFGLNDLIGSTFTISNLGSIGGTYSTPIINLPNVAVLLTGRSRKLPIVLADDRIEVRLMMPLSLSYDHRVVDGAAAARFLNEVKSYLEVPGRLLLAP